MRGIYCTGDDSAWVIARAVAAWRTENPHEKISSARISQRRLLYIYSSILSLRATWIIRIE